MSFADSMKKKITESNTPVTLDLKPQDYLTTAEAVGTLDDEWEKPENSSTYEYYNGEYNDDSYSVIDKNKNVTLSSEQINLTQEKNSQYIPFMMPRFYDGFDLSTAKLSIFWVNEDKNGSFAQVVDVYRNADKIKFALLVDKKMTAKSGKISFEIHAEGKNSKNYEYLWKTKPNDGLNVLQSLQAETVIEPDETWQTNFISKVTEQADRAEQAASDAQKALQSADALVKELENGISQEVQTAIGDNYYTRKQTDDAINNAVSKVDVTEQLENYAKKTEIPTKTSQLENDSNYLTEHQDISGKADVGHNHTLSEIADYQPVSLDGYATEEFVNDAVSKADVTEQLEGYYKKEETLSASEIEEKIKTVDVSSQLSEYAKTSEVEQKETALSSSIEENKTNIESLSSTIKNLQETVGNVDTSPKFTYDVAYNDTEDAEVGENVFVLYEIENEGEEDEVRTPKKKFTIVGSSGGGATSSSLKIGYVTTSPVVATVDDRVLIKYTFSGTDSSGDEVPEGDYTWKIGSRTIATGTAVKGENTFDATDYVSVGTQKLTLQIKDSAGSLVTKPWTVQVVDVRIESTFNDTQKFQTGKAVSFNYTPYGAISKTIHFKLDGEEIYSTTTTSSGIPVSYSIQPREHGSHLAEVYITAEINNSTIESNHIFKDIIWFDDESDVPVIGCVSKNITVKQYDTAAITYTVFDSSTETPVVTLAVDGKEVSTLTLDKNTQTWLYKATEIGGHVLTITCGSTVKTINVTVEKLDIDVSPVMAGLEFDFNPVGRSNNDADKLWSDENSDVSMTVSENFDWVNGGYQIDENGDQYFCVKSGTTATINYNLFADDPKRDGKEFKVIFKTTKVRDRKASFISCMNNGIGLDMKIETAYVYSSNDNLYSPYCEDDIIEFEFNINKDTDIPMVLTYEDGVANRPMIYTSDSSFMQTTPQPITIGSDDCDVHIYRMKAYSNSLSDRDVLSNFIADSRNAEEMINRYNRNQIYDENGSLVPEVLAEKRPNLKIIMLDAPWFTNDKSNKVSDTIITMIHKDGDPVLDNWTCTGAQHSGRT